MKYMEKNILTSIGLMSGTSMDGIDAALLRTDGKDVIEEICSISLSYTNKERSLLKEAESSIRAGITSGRVSEEIIREIEAFSTMLHIEAVNQLLTKANYTNKDVDIIGYHGQTMYHKPKDKISIILGDGKLMAKSCNIPVINDFRRNDINHGGRGAPFAPIYHLALSKRDKKIPSVIVNCGGIANITIITDDDPLNIKACDTGPGNGLIDRLVYMRTGGMEFMDENGKYGSKGSVNKDVLDMLYANSIMQDGVNFFDLYGPKALDINDMNLIPEIEALSIEDACRTLEAFTADSIVRGAGDNFPKKWILAGGGWNNPVILNELKVRLNDSEIVTADEIGWNSKALEAQIFAYLAVRSKKWLNLSFPNTTGVSTALSGGVFNEIRSD